MLSQILYENHINSLKKKIFKFKRIEKRIFLLRKKKGRKCEKDMRNEEKKKRHANVSSSTKFNLLNQFLPFFCYLKTFIDNRKSLEKEEDFFKH